MQLYDFVEWELEYFRQNCNFTPDELAYFELRSKYKSNVEIALTMHISEAKVSKLARKVKDKIISEDLVLDTLSRLGKELRDFIKSLYTATASKNERILLNKIITDLKNVT